MTGDGPLLAPPGAGVPARELIWVRPAFVLMRLCTPDTSALARFRREADKMTSWVASIPAEEAARQVLIKRVVGIEDSSRYWSAFMVLEHLRIVNEIVVRIIETLAAGRPFAVEIRTADVKPSASVKPEVLSHFTAGVNAYVNRVPPALRKRSTMRHAHPWFGPLTAHGWHCLAAIHHTLHRRQLSTILRSQRPTTTSR
jgi:hypothetical protein